MSCSLNSLKGIFSGPHIGCRTITPGVENQMAKKKMENEMLGL